MTYPGVPASPGFPPLEGVGQQAIRMAQDRLGVLTRGQFPLPVKQLSEEEKTEALKSAKDDICMYCGGLHPAPNTPACPRISSFELNPDGKLIKGTFWPDGISDSTVDLDKDGNLLGVHHEVHHGYDASRIVFAADLAEEDNGEDEAAVNGGAG
jgi:hypothetical protein